MSETPHDPYLAGLDLVKQHPGTSGQAAIAKCILSLYNPHHYFSMGEILGPLDERYTRVVQDMVNEYATRGETETLRQAGRWVYEEFPRLVALSDAMRDARDGVWRKWDQEREEQARIEQEEEDRRIEERERSAIILPCAYCKTDTKHYSIVGTFNYECSECYEQQAGV